MTGKSTEALIDSLVSGFQPTSPHALARRLAVALFFGASAALLIVLVFYGIRDDFAAALSTSSFWMKWLYTLAFAVIGALLYRRLARPGREAGKLGFLMGAPMLLLSSIAFWDLRSLPAGERGTALWGSSALSCPWSIAFIATPVFVVLLMTLRRAAPTNLRSAGFAAGLLAGGVGAFIYGVHCTESTTAFVAAWYTIGMLLPAVLGALVGPRLLRW
jgi:hypothetical protein